LKTALLWEPVPGDEKKVHCLLCRHECEIAEGRRGICGVRLNDGGTLWTLNYGLLVAANIDPVEKKPLYHFLPGTGSFSIASAGCNFRCTHCQNSSISQVRHFEPDKIPGDASTPESVVAAALRTGCQSISYTYTEPTIFFEFALETARLAADKGLKNIFVSNGYTGSKATEMMAPVLHANNIDLKSFSDEHYRKVCGAKLQPVLETIRHMHSLGIWLEITTLVIPGHNDSDAELNDISGFIASLDPSIPWHISRFHPAYKMSDVPVTPTSSLVRARDIGRKNGLKFIYIGNVQGKDFGQTRCPSCNALAVDRQGYVVGFVGIEDGKCRQCGFKLAGVWQ